MEIRKIKTDEIDKLKYLFEHKDFDKYKNDVLNDLKSNIRDIYILIENEKLIGELTVYYKTSKQYETIDNIRVYLSAYRISKEYRNKGLGQKLLQYTITDLENKGYTEFTIGAENNNANARYIYQKFGFNKVIDRCIDNYDGNKYEYDLLLKSYNNKGDNYV